MTPMVVLLQNVFLDLRVVLFFYSILILLLAQFFSIIGLGNSNREGVLKDLIANGTITNGSKPGSEYNSVGLFVGEILWTLRMSVGDFSAIDAASYLTETDFVIFWIVWLITITLTTVIFLNLIVAEASASYSRVMESIEKVIW